MNRKQKKYREDKRALVTDLLSGKADKQDLTDYKLQQTRPYMVVYSLVHPQPTDLVDTRLADEQGRSRVTYAEFLANLDGYGRYCVAVEHDIDLAQNPPIINLIADSNA